MDTEWLYTPDEYGETPLSRVAKSGRAEISRLMIMQEINDAHRELSVMPALHRAAYWGYEDAVKDLIEDGADPSEMDGQGETPLHKAARLGNDEAVETLLMNGAEPDAPNSLGLTPLHWAALTGQEEIIESLLSYGANPFRCDWVTGGMTALDFARCMGYKEASDVLERNMAIV